VQIGQDQYRIDVMNDCQGKLKMTTGMMADKYMAKFEMLMGRTSFNKVALEDTFIWYLPQPILSKVYSQTSLLLCLDNWRRQSCAIWTASIRDSPN